jgi:hypothetical protein
LQPVYPQCSASTGPRARARIDELAAALPKYYTLASTGPRARARIDDADNLGLRAASLGFNGAARTRADRHVF